MSKEINNESAFWEVATAISAEKKVFITSGPTTLAADLVQAGALEVVCFGEDFAIEGVKSRQDFKERRNSKDLLIDVEGELSLEVVERLLKKYGAFISVVEREWSDYFNHVCPVVWSAPKETDSGEQVQSLEYSDETDEALFWVAASHLLPPLPEIAQLLPTESVEASALREAQEEIAELKAELKKIDRLKRSTQTRASNLKISLDAHKSELQEAQESQDELKTELRSLKRKVSASEKSKEKHKELKAEFKQISRQVGEHT